jgi:hypothetical protein
MKYLVQADYCDNPENGDLCYEIEQHDFQLQRRVTKHHEDEEIMMLRIFQLS